MVNQTKIKYTKKACKITDNIFKNLKNRLKNKEFKTELDIFKFLKHITYKNKCKLAFKPIVAIGKNAATIHHKATNTKIKQGFLVIDFGVKYNGYCSDCTRTFYFGKPKKQEIKLYNLILNAQLTAISQIKQGVYAADIDLITRQILYKHFKNFVHATGHGVGKYIHMSPKIFPNSKSILKANQIITVEPGLYFKNKLGIRIEDTILVKKNTHEILTKTNKNLIII
jgi:Xaa-Pro aminopeptidase